MHVECASSSLNASGNRVQVRDCMEYFKQGIEKCMPTHELKITWLPRLGFTQNTQSDLLDFISPSCNNSTCINTGNNLPIYIRTCLLSLMGLHSKKSAHLPIVTNLSKDASSKIDKRGQYLQRTLKFVKMRVAENHKIFTTKLGCGTGADSGGLPRDVKVPSPIDVIPRISSHLEIQNPGKSAYKHAFDVSQTRGSRKGHSFLSVINELSVFTRHNRVVGRMNRIFVCFYQLFLTYREFQNCLRDQVYPYQTL